MDPDPGGPKTYGSDGSGFESGSATLLLWFFFICRAWLRSVPWRVNPAVLSLAVEVFLNQADTEMLAALSLPRHPDNIPQPVLHERIKVPNAAFGRLQDVINILVPVRRPTYPKVRLFIMFGEKYS
jgi:hypothetical protein